MGVVRTITSAAGPIYQIEGPIDGTRIYACVRHWCALLREITQHPLLGSLIFENSHSLYRECIFPNIYSQTINCIMIPLIRTQVLNTDTKKSIDKECHDILNLFDRISESEGFSRLKARLRF